MNPEKTVDELDAEIKALLAQRDEALKASKDTDLETVKRLCKQHGFTATMLRGHLKTKGKAKKIEDGDTGAEKSATAKAPSSKKK
jgi:hypothetical protein